MKRLLFIAATFLLLPIVGGSRSSAQSMEDLNLEVHGYATQGFTYSTNNNWNTTDSTDGSAAWTEAVVNVTAEPEPKLRIGVQARYFLLGNYGNTITLDWAQANYKVNEKFGFRAGKVKTPLGLFNDTQDIDPAHLWTLLPQSVYPLSSRNSTLAHFGVVAYGTLALGEYVGKLDYHGFAGVRVIGGDDGYFEPMREHGLVLPNGVSGPVYGASLAWHTPIRDLTLGATGSLQHAVGPIEIGPMRGTLQALWMEVPFFFAKYDSRRLMVAGEYTRLPLRTATQFPGVPAITFRVDRRSFYLLSSYKVTDKVSAGVYYSSSIDRQAAFTSARYQKDWALSGRYEFSPYLYLKLEQHLMRGTEIGYGDSADGLKPNTLMTLLKLGVSF